MIVIIGAGHAGVHTALALRQAGYQDPIKLVDRDSHLPYERPPLSKGFLKGDIDQQRLLFRPESTYREKEIELCLGEDVVALDEKRKTLTLSSGHHIDYDSLVLAMGMRARTLSVDDTAKPFLYSLRTLQDALRLRERLADCETAPLLVVGGGFIGLEVAASARLMGWNVTVVEMADQLMGRAAYHELGSFVAARHRQAGVDIRMQAKLGAMSASGGSMRADIDGCPHNFSAVLMGIGGTPDFGFLSGKQWVTSKGIIVDKGQRTQAPDIYAVGDIAISTDRFLAVGLCLESVQNALYGAKIVAHTITGQNPPRLEVPWFWTDQYDQSIQMAGIIQPHYQWFCRTDAQGGASWFGLDEYNAMRVCQSVNRARDYALSRRAIENQWIVETPSSLADNDIDLKQLLSG